MAADEWIGVEEVAAEMRYTIRQAWEYVRSIGLVVANGRKMSLARFTRAEFNEARERSLKPITPRVATGAVRTTAAETPAKKPKTTNEARYAESRAKLKKL